MNLKGRDFLTLKDYTPEEIEYLIELAAKLKKMKKDGVVEQPLLGKNVALIFEKTSTRTRCSFEVAAHDLGMGVTYLDPKGVKFVYMGDARYNMGNSLMIVCSKLGLHFTACTAKEYFPDEALVNQCKEWAAQSGGSVTLTEDVEEGTKGAEVLYTDVWVSMGEPDEVWNERIKALLPYQINKKVMDNADKKAIFMHCLPAFHDLKTTIGKQIHDKFGLDEMEVTDEVFESEQSVVFDEAENRMHTIKAVMAATLGAY